LRIFEVATFFFLFESRLRPIQIHYIFNNTSLWTLYPLLLLLLLLLLWWRWLQKWIGTKNVWTKACRRASDPARSRAVVTCYWRNVSCYPETMRRLTNAKRATGWYRKGSRRFSTAIAFNTRTWTHVRKTQWTHWIFLFIYYYFLFYSLRWIFHQSKVEIKRSGKPPDAGNP